MSAQAQPAETKRPLYPRRKDYEPSVRVFVPTAQGEELSLRASILLMRDHACAAKRDCSDQAYPVLEIVERLGSLYAYAAMPADALDELQHWLMQLVTCASGLETVADILSGPALEGVDGRG